jgi:hypothetical protein
MHDVGRFKQESAQGRNRVFWEFERRVGMVTIESARRRTRNYEPFAYEPPEQTREDDVPLKFIRE